LKFLREEEAVFPYELLVKVDITSAIIRSLDADEIPMNLAAVAIVSPLIGLSGCEMKGTANLFVKEDVAHRLADMGIESKRELADVPSAFV
jgi:hypothetical protein